MARNEVWGEGHAWCGSDVGRDGLCWGEGLTGDERGRGDDGHGGVSHTGSRGQVPWDGHSGG